MLMCKRAIAEADEWARLYAFQDQLGEQKGFKLLSPLSDCVQRLASITLRIGEPNNISRHKTDENSPELPLTCRRRAAREGG